ncbi:hypothetical protein Tco_0481646 [Tanacetum coccineum]
MIGCKAMRTLASVEIEIILILGLPCCLSSSSMRCLENVVEMSQVVYPVFVDTVISTRTTELRAPSADPVKTKTPESPHTIASLTSLLDSTPYTCHVEESEGSDTSGARSTSSDSTAPLSPDHPLNHTTPTLVPILRRTTRMAVCVPPAMSPGLSASIAEVAAMSDLAFCKRFRSFYESSPSSSPPDLPSRKRYRGTSKLVEDDEEEDKEIEESSNYDSKSNDVEDEGHYIVDEVLLQGRGYCCGGGVPGIGLALTRREIALGKGRMLSVFKAGQSSRSVPESKRPERVSALRQPTLTTWIDLEDGIAYIDVPAYPPPAPPTQTPPSPEWLFGSLPVSLAPSIVEMQEGLIHDHTVRLGELSPDLFERYDRDLGELFTRSGVVRDEIFSQRYRFRSLMYEHERFALTFRELRLQIAEERRTRLDLAEIVDSMKKGQEPRGDA